MDAECRSERRAEKVAAVKHWSIFSIYNNKITMDGTSSDKPLITLLVRGIRRTRLPWNGKLLSRAVSKITGRFRIDHFNVFYPEIDYNAKLNLAAFDSTRFEGELFYRLFFRETDIPCIPLIWFGVVVDIRIILYRFTLVRLSHGHWML